MSLEWIIKNGKLVINVSQTKCQKVVCGAICKTKCPRNPAWGICLLLLKHYIHSISWARKSSTLKTHTSKQTFVAFL